jgi:hypothetical protein
MMSEMMEVIGGTEGVTKSFDFVRILTSRFDTADQNHKQVARWMALTYGEWLMENRMILTTALDAAGTRKATYYEAGFSSGSRATYLRGLDCFDAVNREIEDLVVACGVDTRVRRDLMARNDRATLDAAVESAALEDDQPESIAGLPVRKVPIVRAIEETGVRTRDEIARLKAELAESQRVIEQARLAISRP